MKMLTRLFLALSLALGAAPAFADGSNLLGIYNADNVPLCTGQAGTIGYNNGCIAVIHPEGLLFGTTASAATTGTSAQVLGTYSLPANALDVAGRRLRIRGMFSTAANTNSKTCSLNFGSESVAGTTAVSGAGMQFELEVVKTGASTQIVWGDGQEATVLITPYSAAATETDTAAITITAKCTTATASGDATMQDMFVEYMN